MEVPTIAVALRSVCKGLNQASSVGVGRCPLGRHPDDGHLRLGYIGLLRTLTVPEAISRWPSDARPSQATRGGSHAALACWAFTGLATMRVQGHSSICRARRR